MAGQKIAFLGTGLMGAPMARNLIAAGHAVTVWNRTHAKAEALVADGATLASTPADAVADCTVAIAIVSNGDAVAELLFDAGVAEAMPEASVFIDMSSVTPAEARDHAETHAVDAALRFAQRRKVGPRLRSPCKE